MAKERQADERFPLPNVGKTLLWYVTAATGGAPRPERDHPTGHPPPLPKNPWNDRW